MLLALAAAGAASFGAVTAAAPVPTASPTTTTPTTPTSATATTTATTAAPPTTAAATTTAPAPNLLAGVNWIQSTFASPCGDSLVQLIGGSAVQGSSRAVLDEVAPLQPSAGLAVAFLSCHGAGEATTETTVVVVKVGPGGDVQSVAERELGPRGRIVAVDGNAITIETPVGEPPAGECCAPSVRRETLTASASGFTVTADEQIATSEQTDAVSPAVGRNASLVRGSVPATALCFRWDDVWLAAAGQPGEPSPPSEPSAELQTIRLALIHITGQWIAPTGEMSAEMAQVVTAYQEDRGLAVDGVIGRETTSALRADLGCPGSGSFTMVPPRGLGPRNFATVSSLVAATNRFARVGRSGYASLDHLLTDARWNGDNALFLGCERRNSPSTGVTCSWSGATPLQLVGIVRDGSVDGVSNFTILYARSTAV